MNRARLTDEEYYDLINDPANRHLDPDDLDMARNEEWVASGKLNGVTIKAYGVSRDHAHSNLFDKMKRQGIKTLDYPAIHTRKL